MPGTQFASLESFRSPIDAHVHGAAKEATKTIVGIDAARRKWVDHPVDAFNDTGNAIQDWMIQHAHKDMLGQAHESFAIAAVLRKKYDVAITEFKLATENVPNVDPTT